MRAYLFLGLAAVTAASGCNMVKFTANQTAPVLNAAAPGFNQEADVQLAREAAPGQLKTVEGFHLATPENHVLIKILAQGYCEYAFGFLEGDMEQALFEKQDAKAEALGKRATGLYLRCMNYGLKMLDSDWEKAIHGETARFEAVVKDADEDDVPGMFFTALGLASAINLNRDDIELAAYLPKAKLMFERVVQLDDGYHNGIAHMALALMYTTLPKALGGDPDKGKAEFERAIAVTEGKFLMPKVMMAYVLGVGSNDQKFFHETLVKVLETSPAVFPDQRLGNEIAHIKARRYLTFEKELF